MQCGMLGNEVWNVGKFSNGRNGVYKPFAGRNGVVVIMLIEKYSIWHFLTFANACNCICGEPQKVTHTLKSR